MAMSDCRRLTRFVDVMAKKLEANSHKLDWRCEECSMGFLEDRLRDELLELENATTPAEIVEECADIANFAMMIADKARGQKQGDD